MLKSFKLILSLCIVTASSYGVIAQTESFKDVLLDGKPAKLNLVTGEVLLVDAKWISVAVDKKQSKDTTNTISPKKAEQPKATLQNLEPSKSSVSVSSKEITSMVYEIAQPTYEDNDSDFHVVQKGETLYALSQRYRTSLAQLKSSNNLETTLIKTGQTLRVKNFESLYDGTIWTVSKGDTLYAIAKKTNTTVAILKALNGLTSDLIKVGQVLQLK